MFPLHPSTNTHMIRNREELKVNKTHTATFKKSAIPYLLRKLNIYFNNPDKDVRGPDQARREGSE